VQLPLTGGNRKTWAAGGRGTVHSHTSGGVLKRWYPFPRQRPLDGNRDISLAPHADFTELLHAICLRSRCAGSGVRHARTPTATEFNYLGTDRDGYRSVKL
jgi:hypothetical protein